MAHSVHYTTLTLYPSFRGESSVLTISFHTANIPEQDVEKWLSRYCNILMAPQKRMNEWVFWKGEYRAIIALRRGNWSKLKHLPKYFFLGIDRGITR